MMVLLGMMLLVMMVVAVAVVVVPVTVEEKVRQAGRQERGIKMDWTTNQSGEDEVKKEKKKSEGCSSKSTQADQRRTDTHRQTHRWLTTPPGISHFFSGLPCLPASLLCVLLHRVGHTHCSLISKNCVTAA